jgi:peptidoglycan/LPS O-acetylase OafA/YrhL
MTKNLQNRHHPALDGLRGFACILVVCYHNFPFIHGYLFFGWMAVDIFFVLSGFLITNILVHSFDGIGYLKNFYVRRALRVFPLYYVMLAFYMLILPHIPGLPIRMDYFVRNQAWFWTFFQNWLLIFKPSNSEYALNHLWSMGVEEQFYLLWPLAFAFIRKPKVLFALLSLLLIAVIIVRFWLWDHHFEGLPYYNLFTFTRVDGICIGCMVALLQKINIRFIGKYTALIVFAFAAFNFIFYWFNLQYNDSYPYLALVGFSTLSMIFGLLVYYIVNHQAGIFEKVFDIRILKYFGTVSYGTYIFHWPLYLCLNPFLVPWISRYTGFSAAQFLSSIFCTTLAFVMGHFSYYYFEMKFLRLKKHFA